MTYTYNTEQRLPFPIELVFAFFSNPENLPRLMPKWQKARIEEASFAPPPPHPAPAKRMRGIAAGVGTRVTMSFRPFPFSPIRLPWEAEITQFEWNDHFCDVQVRGPFAQWKHCHQLVRDGEGTLLKDSVEYELPFANVLQPLVRFQVVSIFKYRQARTAELLPLMSGASR
jgi:ligand-binding SRPBCC domain-containing protein